MPSTRPICLLLAVAAVAIVMPRGHGVALAQPAPAAPGDDANIGIFVRDSAIAAEKLALAERMERAQEWDTSAEVYQEVLDGYADRVVPTHTDAQGRPDRYGGVTTVIQDRIAAWPEAGRDVYVTRYAGIAARLLESADPSDRAALAQVASRYFVTDAGRDASLRLIELYFDSGEFVAAASLADRLLDHHPAIDATRRPLLLLRSALSWNLAGERSRAEPRAQLLAKEFAGATATLGGQERVLSEVAATELARPRTETARLRTSSWPMPFGSNDHAAIAKEQGASDASASNGKPREWGKLMSFSVTPGTPAMPGQEQAALRAIFQRQRELGAMSGILPSLDGDQLFFQDNVHLSAVSLATGAPLPGWLQTHVGDGRYKSEGTPTPRGAQMGVTLTDRQVLAIMGQSEGNSGRSGSARLVCLDRQTGKHLWSRRMSEVTLPGKAGAPPKEAAAAEEPAPEPPPQVRERIIVDARGRRIIQRNGVPVPQMPAAPAGDESIRLTDPCGSVLVVNDAVYVVSRGGQPGAFEDCYLVCFGLADGQVRWARHLASGNMARANYSVNAAVQNMADSHLAYSDGRIFVSTDMGAVAAVEAADGSLAWLSLYPRPRVQVAQPWGNPEAQSPSRVEPAYAGNPVIVRDGKVLTLPVDGEHLFVHDALTGQELARVPMRWRLTEEGAFPAPGDAPAGRDRFDTSVVLAGLAGDSVVLASAQAVSVLDWNKLQGDTPAQQALVYRRELRKGGYEDDAIRGRPFVTDQSIYVPTAWKLFRLNRETGVALEQYPVADGDHWDARRDESPGNVTVVNGSVIIAGSERVTVYSGLDLVRQRLDAAIAAQPGAVAPRLRYAEAMFNAGHGDEVLHWLDAAIAQVRTPDGRLASGADRNAVFEGIMSLVRQMSGRSRPATASTLQAQLMERLAAVADAPPQQASYRLLHATLATREKDYATAVGFYQSLVEEPTWSSLRLKLNGDAVPMGQHAAGEIKRILGIAGRDPYAAIEARAQAALAEARGGRDAKAFFAIAARFPNAQAATDAMRAAGELLTRGGAETGITSRDRAALRRIADGLVQPADRAALNESLLRSYLAEGNIAAALGRARRIAWTDANHPLTALPPIASTGTRITASTASDVAAQLQAAHFEQQEARLPDLNANYEGGSFEAEGIVSVAGVSSLLAPLDAATARHDRVITIARDRSLKVFAPGAADALATIRVPQATDKADVAWLGGTRADRFIMRQQAAVTCVDSAAGNVVWTFDPKGLPQVAAEVASLTVDDAGLVALVNDAPPEQQPPQQQVEQLTPQELQIQQAAARGQMDPLVAQQVLQQLQQRRQQRVFAQRQVIAGNVVNDGSWEADPRQEDDKEIVVAARAAAGGAVVVVTTSRGRAVGIDADTGKTLWRASIGDRAPAQLRVVDDVAVFATTDESSSRVVALDAFDGTEVLRVNFNAGSGGRVCNIGVSDEGWLVIVQPGTISSYDLLGGERQKLDQRAVQPEVGGYPFARVTSPQQVQFCGDKVLVVADPATPSTTVRMYDLPKLEPTRITDARTQQTVDRRFVPRYPEGQRTGNEVVSIAVHKDRLYTMTGLTMSSDPILDARQIPWKRTPSDQPSLLSVQSPLLVKEGVVLVAWPRDYANRGAPSAHIELYSRQTVEESREVGMLVEDVELKRGRGLLVDRFQCVTGGIYYTTSDGTLHFLPGRPKS